MSALIKYDQARQALAACRSVDEVKDIRDKSEAMRLYAKQAQDTELEQWAAEIKFRAQRALGEISAALEKQKNQAALPTGGKSKSEALADAGISTSTANRYEKLAAIPEPVIEEAIAKSREAGKPVSAKAVLAQLAPRAGAGAGTPPAVSPTTVPAAAPATRPTLVQQVSEQQAAANNDQGDQGASSHADPSDEADPFDQLRTEYDEVLGERDRLKARNAELEALLAQNDLAAQVDYWKSAFEGMSSRNAGLIKKLNIVEPDAESQREALKQIRLALGVERNSDIVPALKARRAA